MGYSIPAAIGAKIAAPDRTVVAVCGDGAFQMNMMELATICQHGVDVKMVVMSNGKLGLIKEIQRKSYKNNESAVDLTGSPDIMAIAGAYGIPARKLENMDGAQEAISEMFAHDGPYLMVCVVDENESSV